MRTARRIHLRPVAALAALLLAALAAGLAPGSAAADHLADVRAQADKAQAELDSLNSQIEVAAERYNAAQVKLDETNSKISENRKLLDASRHNLKVSRAELSAMLVDAYRQGDPDLVAMLLNANSIDDVVDQTRFVQRATSHAAQVVADVRTYTHDVKRREVALERERSSRQDQLAQRKSEEDAVKAALADRQALLDSLSTEISQILEQRAAARRAQAAQLAAGADAVLQEAAAAAANQDLAIGGSADGGSADTGVAISAPPSSSVGAAAVQAALSQLGVPYVWAGADPSTGFDCSGLVMWAYAQVGVSLPHYSGAQYAMGTPVPLDQLQPGDLISFGGSSHIAMYIGNGQIVEAPQTGDVVKIAMLADHGGIDGAVRIG